MPYGPAIGNELENADSVIRIDGTAGKMRSCTIKFSTPTEFTDELGDHFPGQPIDTMRASSVDFEYYMRNDAAKRLREGSEGKEVRFDAEFGSEEGRKVVVSCPRIKNKMPAINAFLQQDVGDPQNLEQSMALLRALADMPASPVPVAEA